MNAASQQLKTYYTLTPNLATVKGANLIFQSKIFDTIVETRVSQKDADTNGIHYSIHSPEC